MAGFGAFVAARQSWLQWYPPEVVSCGRDFYGMIENFPLQRAVPMIFKGSGDCTKVDWTFLGGSIANWSFVAFTGMALLALLTTWRALLADHIANTHRFAARWLSAAIPWWRFPGLQRYHRCRKILGLYPSG